MAETFPLASIDALVIDTDHNYWTLQQELRAFHDKLAPQALVFLHDTVIYAHRSEYAYQYGVDVPYPLEKMVLFQDKGLVDAVQDDPRYQILEQSDESCGAMALRKAT